MKRHLATLLLFLLIATPTLLVAKRKLCCGPLNAHHFSLLVKGGVDFTYYIGNEEVWLTSPRRVFSLNAAPSFGEQFTTPWRVGVEAAWNPTGCIQLFLEYAYSHAEGKHHPFEDTGLFEEIYSNYDAHAGYLGARYYLRGCCLPCGLVTPYGGFKAGFVVQEAVPYTLLVDGGVAAATDYWKSQTAVSGGLQLGLEWWFYNCLSLVLQGEFIATQGLRPNQNVLTDATQTGGITNINLGGVKWVVAWPITLGLRYTF